MGFFMFFQFLKILPIKIYRINKNNAFVDILPPLKNRE